MARVLMLYIVL